MLKESQKSQPALTLSTSPGPSTEDFFLGGVEETKGSLGLSGLRNNINKGPFLLFARLADPRGGSLLSLGPPWN